MLHSGNRSEVKALIQEWVVVMDRPMDDPLRVAICDRLEKVLGNDDTIVDLRIGPPVVNHD